MKNNKLWTILMAVVLILQAAAEALTVAIILRLDMLPDKYVIALVAVMGLLVLIIGLLMFVRVKGGVSKARRVISCVLALLIVALCAVASTMVAQAYETMNNVTGGEVSTRDVYVFVRTEDAAQSLADAKGYTFGALENYNQAQVDLMIEKIKEETGETPKVVYYGKNTELADALFSGQLDALIMNGASTALLLEEENYGTFFDKVRILATISNQSSSGGNNGSTLEGDITNTPFIIYVSGSDTRSSKLTVSRSDVNILMVINPVTKQVLLLNTPRDYYIPNPAGNGALDKLTHCGLYGPDCSMEALEDLYDTQIHYYGQINFTGFETLIDAVGGVTIYSDQSFTARDTKIVKGENHLNGAQALDFSRERYHVSGGDNGRGKNQMKVITAVIEKMTSGTTVLANYADILESLGGTFTTDLEMSDISALVKMQLSDMASWDIRSFAVVGTGGNEKTYSAPGHTAYVMFPDEDVVAQASGLIDKVLGGQKLTEDDLKIK